MKTIAYFSDYTLGQIEEEKRIQEIRTLTEADRIMAVMSHDYLQNGLLPEEVCKTRARKGLCSGANMILQMSSYASLSSLGIYAFTAARLLDRLGMVDQVVLEVEDATYEELNQITFLLIANTRAFQQKVTQYRANGLLFLDAQAKAIGEIIPGGERIMQSWYNVFAVECMRSLKILYSSIQCICVPRLTHSTHKTIAPKGLSDLLKITLHACPHDLFDYYGGYDALSARIREHRESYVDFTQFSSLIAGNDKDISDIRKFFLRVICRITKSTVGIWRLYDFTPYCRVYTDTDQTYQLAKSKSDIFLFQEPSEIAQMEPYKQDLWKREQEMKEIINNI